MVHSYGYDEPSDQGEGPYRESSKPKKDIICELWTEMFFSDHTTHSTYIGTFPKSEVYAVLEKETDRWIELLKTPQIIKVGEISVVNTQYITHIKVKRIKPTTRSPYPIMTPPLER